MPRNTENWLKTYIEFCDETEAPLSFHFWTGVATIAGALGRKTWIDMRHFIWVPNFYIFLVAPPGIATKSSCIRIGQRLLTSFEDVNLGPDIVTMPALIEAFENSRRIITLPDGELFAHSSISSFVAELGNFYDPTDRAMTDALVELWDAQDTTLRKYTRHCGKAVIENPCFNWIAGTTPAWLVGNVPEYMIGGGLTSRCLFVYAEAKRQFIPYPDERTPKDNYRQTEKKLREDLGRILEMAGEFTLSADARVLGRRWYEDHWQNPPDTIKGTRHEGYLARKQSHIHKLAMVLSAAKRDSMVIEEEDLKEAIDIVSASEADMLKAFEHVGSTEESRATMALIQLVKVYGKIKSREAWRMLFQKFRNREEFNKAIDGAIAAGYIKQFANGSDMFLVYVREAKDNAGESQSTSQG